MFTNRKDSFIAGLQLNDEKSFVSFQIKIITNKNAIQIKS